jgi:hypothetical protein
MLEKIAPTWMNVSMKMKDDEETDKAFGWVLEMYNHIFHIDMILTSFFVLRITLIMWQYQH